MGFGRKAAPKKVKDAAASFLTTAVAPLVASDTVGPDEPIAVDNSGMKIPLVTLNTTLSLADDDGRGLVSVGQSGGPYVEMKTPVVGESWTDYERLLDTIRMFGESREDRTGTGTIGLFGTQMRFHLWQAFPLITTKRVFWKGVVEELLWFLRGATNVRSLQRAGVSIWDEWAKPNGDVGPIYGYQWRAWPGKPTVRKLGGGNVHIEQEPIDQIAWLINEIKTNPNSRRLILSAWNVADLPDMALPPCHLLAQFYVANGRLSCQLYMRSADMFLGVPFNIASYSLLTHIMAHYTGFDVGDLVVTLGDSHIYKNHLEQVDTQLKRVGRDLPQIRVSIPENTAIEDLDISMFELVGYDPHPAIKGEVSV
jgi:thymidylate synthase